MPGFYWEVSHDIALATEVVSRCPNKPVDWAQISEALNQSFLLSLDKPVLLKGRGCKERMDLLLKKYRDEDRRALKR